MLIRRFVLAEDTILDFSKLDYTQQKDKSKVNVGCGNLEYIPHLWTDKNDPRSQLV